MNVLGIDIGGANLKFADSAGNTSSLSFPMWKQHQQLADTLVSEVRSFSAIERIGITMTGEMADCFATRTVGVHYIVEAVQSALHAYSVRFYAVDGNWYDAPQAKANPLQVAASNWRALAQWVASLDDRPLILLDIGSTTTDIIPLANGRILTESKTDWDRLIARELVYTGIERSNVSALLSEVRLGNQTIATMNEFFADSLDAYIVLGKQTPTDHSAGSADNTSRSVNNCANRLLRCVGADLSTSTLAVAKEVALAVEASQLNRISDALRTVRERYFPAVIPMIFLVGHGNHLAQQVIAREKLAAYNTSKIDAWSEPLARCAPSFALARLAAHEPWQET